MELRTKRRRILIGLGSILGGMVIFLGALPVWFPWVLGSVLEHQGIRYRNYERQGFSRFSIQDVGWTNNRIRLKIERLEALLPTAWLLELANPTPRQPETILVQGWDVTVIPAPPAQPDSLQSSGSFSAMLAEADSIAAKLRTWVPAARMTQGKVNLAGDAIESPELRWSAHRGVEARVKWPGRGLEALVDLQLGTNGVDRLVLRSDPAALQSTLAISGRESPRIEGSGQWLTNRFSFDVLFGNVGWLPEKAKASFPDFAVPAKEIGLEGYQTVRGDLGALWSSNQFQLRLTAAAQPASHETNLPPITFRAEAKGDTNRITIQSATLASPFLSAELSRDLVLSFSGELLSGPTNLRLFADLDRQTWLVARGQIQGEAMLVPQAGRYPRVTMSLSGTNVVAKEVASERIEASAVLDYPWLNLERLRVDLPEQTHIALDGSVNLRDRVIQDGHVRVAGTHLPSSNFAQVGSDRFSLVANCAGSFTNLNHAGTVEIRGLKAPELKPLQINGAWTGRQFDLSQASLSAETRGAALQVRGTASLNPGGFALGFDQLLISTNDRPCLELRRPARMAVGWTEVGVHTVDLGDVELVGPAGSLRFNTGIQFPITGRIDLAATNFSPVCLIAFFERAIPEIQISRFEFIGGWTNGPIHYRLEMNAGMPSRSVAATVRMEGNGSGTIISNASVSRSGSTIASAKGSLPLRLLPGSGWRAFEFLTNSPVAFAVETWPDRQVWDEIGRLTGLEYRSPNVQAKLEGTWKSLEGFIRADIAALKLSRTNQPLPELQDLHLIARINHSSARIEQFTFQVQKQHLRAEGQIPLGDGYRGALGKSYWPDWRQARARIVGDRIAIAAFEPLFPTLLSPQGEIKLDLNLNPGLNLGGGLQISNARTRPLATLGSVYNIQINAAFTNGLLRLERATAEIGGSQVSIAGNANISNPRTWQEGSPPFEMTIRGTNIPLSRRPESIIRSDLDLAVRQTKGSVPVVSGIARLRESIFMTDLTALVPGGATAPERRPPYFSVRQEPFSEWKLGVRVEGPRCLNVRSTLFYGQISANLNLTGTLGDPMALGDLKIDSGIIRLPFADLRVSQGFVSLGSQDPYRPRLNISAGSRQYSYDIKLDLTGTADEPIVQFSSTPPLGSEQILLMVTAGEMPRQQQAFSMQQRGETFAQFLGKDLLAKLGIGDAGEQRLTIKSGEELSEQGRPTYGIDYKLSDRWDLVGEYDRFNAFNAGFKWRIYPK